MKTRHKKLSAWMAISSLGIAPFLMPSIALAANVLEEVVVEAQKKVESITETPIAINAITGEQFQKQASFNFQDIVRATPGLSIEPGGLPDIHLRGTSTVTRSATSQRTNVYQDGALQDNPRTVFDAQFDIERFEILRGPQGTLYGKSSPTGTINVQTKSPNMNTVDGYVSGTGATRDMENVNFGVSLPIIDDVLAVRLSGVYDENRASGLKNDFNGSEALSRSTAGRIVIAFHPTDTFSMRLADQYREHKENPFYAITGAGYQAKDLKALQNENERDFFRDNLATLEMTQELSDHLSLISVTSYQAQLYRQFNDIDATVQPTDIQNTNIDIEPNFQEDFRVVSSDNNFWDWQFGYFYERSGSTTGVDIHSTIPGTANIRILTSPQINREEHAVYTHNTFKLTDDLNLIAGLRYQQGRSTVDQPFTQDVVVPVAPSNNSFVTANFNTASTSYATTGTVKLQYFFSPDLMGYATIDHAFRAGVAQLDIKRNLPPDLAFVPDETANSAELGLKGSFGEQRGRFAVAVYDQVFKNYGQDVYSVPIWDVNANKTAVLSSSVGVAKEAEVRGVEAEVNYLLLDNWDAGLALSFADAHYNDFSNAPCNIGVSGQSQLSPTHLYNSCNLSGDRLPQNPRLAGVFTSNYSLPVTDGMEWYFNTLLNFKDAQIDELTRQSLGGYAIADFFTGLRASGKGPWDVSLWVKNAFDRRVITREFQVAGFGGSNVGTVLPYDRSFTNAPRQVGVTGTYKF